MKDKVGLNQKPSGDPTASAASAIVDRIRSFRGEEVRTHMGLSVDESHNVFAIAGPRGAGKSTALRSALEQLAAVRTGTGHARGRAPSASPAEQLPEVWMAIRASLRRVLETVTVADLARTARHTGDVGDQAIAGYLALGNIPDRLADAMHAGFPVHGF